MTFKKRELRKDAKEGLYEGPWDLSWVGEKRRYKGSSVKNGKTNGFEMSD